eukprot:306178-Pelagomonas_calceolata.AAC.2
MHTSGLAIVERQMLEAGAQVEKQNEERMHASKVSHWWLSSASSHCAAGNQPVLDVCTEI